MTARNGRAAGARAGWMTAGLAACLLALGGLMACESSVGPADGPGQFTVLLTDAPFPFELVAEANVTIGRVDVVGEEGAQTLAEGEQTFNLLELQNGVTAALGSVEMPEGPVHQIRLIVTDASVVLVDEDETDDVPGQTFDLFIPSGAQNGLKIQLDADVNGGMETIATLDFDLEDSFIVQGNPDTPAGILGFIFKPVVHVAGVSQAATADDGDDDEDDDEEEQEEEEQEQENENEEEDQGEEDEEGEGA